MADENGLNFTSRDIDTTYLVVLAALIETVIESRAVLPEELAKKIEGYAGHVNADGKNKSVAVLTGYFAGIARGAKPGKE